MNNPKLHEGADRLDSLRTPLLEGDKKMAVYRSILRTTTDLKMKSNQHQN